MLGWALDSLGYRIRKAERKWRAANPIKEVPGNSPEEYWSQLQMFSMVI